MTEFKFVETKGLKAELAKDAVLYAQFLGGVSFYFKRQALELASDDLRNALTYLAFQRFPVSLDEVFKFIDGSNIGDLQAQLRQFAKETKALEFLKAGRFLRLHLDTDVNDFEMAVQSSAYGEALANVDLMPSESFLQGLKVPSVAFANWQCVEQVRLNQMFLDALRGHYEALAKNNQINEALSLARTLLSFDPLDESTHQRVMQLELHRGNLEGALEQFTACQGVLDRLLGVEPLEETEELAEVIHSLKGSCFEHFWSDSCDE